MEIEQQKKLSGLLLGYYRKKRYQETGSIIYTQKEIIKIAGENYLNLCKDCMNPCSHPIPICSNNTLVQIENGKVFRKDCYYIALCENIGNDFYTSRKYTDKLNQIALNVLTYFDTLNKYVLKDINQQIKQLQIETKNHILYPIILDMYQSSVDIITGIYQPNHQFMELLDWLYPQMIGINQIIASLVLYYYYSHITYIKDKCNYYLDEAAKDYHEYFFPIEFKIKQYMKSHRSIEVIKYMEELLLKYDTSDNPYCASLIYFYYFRVVYNHNPALIEEQIKKLQVSTEKGKDIFMPYQFRLTDSEAGMGYYRIGKYQLSIQHFEKAIGFNINMLKINFAIFAKDCELTNQIKTLKKYLNTEMLNQINHPYLNIVYRYYFYKYSKDMIDKSLANQLENYIVEHVKKIVHKDTPVYHIFLDELNELVKISLAYKKLHLFTN